MDAVAFFGHGVRHFPVHSPVIEGVCTSHKRSALVHKVNGKLVCRSCMILKQHHPMRAGNGRLSLGSYMLITEEVTHYWGNHIMPSPIVVHQATGAMREIVRNLILTPPKPPWMFVAFARSNDPSRLRLTVSNDLMQFAGKFFFPGTIDQPAVERLNRKRVIDLHQAADLTRAEWEGYARAQSKLHESTEALLHLRSIYQRFPNLMRYPIPTIRTPEYNAVRLLAREA